MNLSDFKKLEIIFSFARQAAINDEQKLIDFINFKAQLFEKLKLAFPEKKDDIVLGGDKR